MRRFEDIPWRTVSISTIIAAIPVMFGVNHAYVGWHEEFGNARWVQRAEFLQAQATADANSDKLDFLTAQMFSVQVQGAVAVVSAFQSELDRHLRNQQDTVEWQTERDRLIRQLNRAEQYRDCLMAERTNCDTLRGW